MPEQAKSAERNLVFCHLIRSIEVLEQAFKVRLESADFRNPALLPFKIIYQSLETYFRKHHGLPSQPELIHLVEMGLAATPLMTDHTSKTIMKLVATAYAMPPEDIRPGYVLEHNGPLQKLIDDIKIAPVERQLAEETDREQRERLREQTRMLHEQTRVVQETHEDIFSNVAAMVDGHVCELSGVDFVDMAIGGYTRSSAIGLLAESSGGKTMFGIQSLLEQVNRQRCCAAFFYEQPVRGDIAKRFYSYAGGLSRDEVNCSYADMGDGAKDAIAASSERVNKYCRIFDMSGTAKGQGLGGPPEIDATIGRMLRAQEKFPVQFVLIDWLGPMVKRYHSTDGPARKDFHSWEHLDSALIQLVDLSRKYDLTVMILHQLSPKIMENKSPIYIPDWTSAHECKSFALLLDYVFTFGRCDDISGCMWFSVAKARGSPKVKRLVRMHGGINKIVDAHDDWVQMPRPSKGKYFTTKRMGSRTRDQEQW